MLQQSVSNSIDQSDASWWWEYQFIFHCFYGNRYPDALAGQPLLEATALQNVRHELTGLLRHGVAQVNYIFEFRELSVGLLGLAVEDPRSSGTPFVDGPPTPPPTAMPTSALPNDAVYPGGSGGGDQHQQQPQPPPTAMPTTTTASTTAAGRPRGSFDSPLRDPTFAKPIDVQQWVRFGLVCDRRNVWRRHRDLKKRIQ